MNEKTVKVDTDFIIKAKSEYYEIGKKIEKIGDQLKKENSELSKDLTQISKKLFNYCTTLEQIAYTYSNRKS